MSTIYMWSNTTIFTAVNLNVDEFTVFLPFFLSISILSQGVSERRVTIDGGLLGFLGWFV